MRLPDWLCSPSPEMAYRRRRLRLIVILLLVAGLVLLRTSSCGPGVRAEATLDAERTSTPTDSAQAIVGDCRRLPEDLFQMCAVKALRGDFGRLEEWQRVGYSRGLEIGARKHRVWATTYFPEEGFPRGQMCRWGYPVSERVVAANRLPARTFVWHPLAGIRQVLDTGARSNDTHADRMGAALWVDWWEPHRGMLFGDDNAQIQTVWVIDRR